MIWARVTMRTRGFEPAIGSSQGLGFRAGGFMVLGCRASVVHG